MEAGAQGITVHLREDRRHIRDRDVERIAAEVETRLNLEMAATEEMVRIAERLRPPACCIVPEKRQELTTEGGLDVIGAGPFLAEAIQRLSAAGIEVALFVEPDASQIARAAELGAQAVELHTGTYADAPPALRERELARLREGAGFASTSGLLCHAGHGLSVANLAPVAAIKDIEEFSIGHALVARALEIGLPSAVAELLALLSEANF
jgi:pyridoxine 5-phosphate synthase